MLNLAPELLLPAPLSFLPSTAGPLLSSLPFLPRLSRNISTTGTSNISSHHLQLIAKNAL